MLRWYTDAACTVPVGMTDDLGSRTEGAKMQIPLLDTAAVFYLKDDVGKRTPSTVTVYPVVAHGTADYDEDMTISDDGVTYVAAATGIELAIITDTAVPVYLKQSTGKATEAARDVFLRAIFGSASIDMPAITSGPSIQSLTAMGATITAAFNAVATVKKYIVKEASAEPTSGEWATATAFSSPMVLDTLAETTTYNLWVLAEDADGIQSVSDVQNFQTLTAAAVAPQFSSQPTRSVPTSQGFTVSYAVSNPEGFALTHQISYDGGAFATITPGGSAPNFTYVVTGKTSATAIDVQIRILADVYTTTSSTVEMTTGSLAIAGSLTVTAGDTQAVLDWADATGGADGYDVEYGTTTGYGSSIADPSASTSTVTGLTNATLHYFRVRAHDSVGNVSSWLTATGTPVAPQFFTNDYASGSTDVATNITTLVAGAGASVSVGSGMLTCTDDSTTDVAGWVANYEVGTAPVETFTVRAKTATAGVNYLSLILLQSKATIPTAADAGLGYGPFIRFKSNTAIEAGYRDNTNTLKQWNSATNQWVTWGTGTDLATTSGAYYKVEFVSNATNWQFKIYDASNNLIETTTAIAWDQTYDAPAGKYWYVGGEISAENYYGTINNSLISRV